MLLRMLGKTAKGLILYVGVLACVTVGAAIVGCLFLSNGHVRYLFDPSDLFTFLWYQRAGLKVTIVFVATWIFLLLVEDGILGRPWRRQRSVWAFDPEDVAMTIDRKR